jgi:hypothetical protein
MAHQEPDAFEQLLLNAYPNPERVDCPGDTVTRRLAHRGLPIDHPAVTHISRCSPCFREFKTFQATFLHRRAVLRALSIAAVVAIVSCASTYLLLRQPWRDNQAREAIVNLQEHPILRGADESSLIPKPIILPRGRLTLRIRLPVASEPGTYEVEFLRPGDSDPIAKASGQSEMIGNQAELHMTADAPLRPGAYVMGVRRIPLTWQTYPVIVGDP